jgi:Lon protease-like protein
VAHRLIPVFPLPDVVFFPETVLPLHVFEPRYRVMVKDALAADRMIAVALLRPGWEVDYERNPAYHAVATVGRMDEIRMTRDGRYHFRLIGMTRVRLEDVLRDTPYRYVRAEDIPEPRVAEDEPGMARAKLDLLAAQVGLARELAGSDAPRLILDERISFVAAVNGACAGLPIEPALRQTLLELDDLVERQRRAATILDETLRRVIALKSSTDGKGGSRIVN